MDFDDTGLGRLKNAVPRPVSRILFHIAAKQIGHFCAWGAHLDSAATTLHQSRQRSNVLWGRLDAATTQVLLPASAGLFLPPASAHKR